MKKPGEGEELPKYSIFEHSYDEILQKINQIKKIGTETYEEENRIKTKYEHVLDQITDELKEKIKEMKDEQREMNSRFMKKKGCLIH